MISTCCDSGRELTINTQMFNFGWTAASGQVKILSSPHPYVDTIPKNKNSCCTSIAQWIVYFASSLRMQMRQVESSN